MRSASRWFLRVSGSIFTACLLIWSVVSAVPPDIFGRTGKVRPVVQPSRLGSRTKAGTHEVMMHMPLVAPLFIQDNEFSSSIALVNDAGIATFADLLLSSLDGREITRYRVAFAPHSQRLVQISELLASVVSRETTGRVVVMQSPQLTGMPIAAQLSLTHRGVREPSYIDEEVAMPSAEGSQVLRAVADDDHGSAVVAITSLSDAVQHILIECMDEHAKHFSKSVHLLANETLLTEACSDRTAHGNDFKTVDLPSSNGLHGPIGISLTSDAMPGSFAAFGLARRHERGERFLSSVSFFDPKMLPSGTFVFAGVPVGPSSLLPDGNYVPRLCLANFASTDSHVSVKYARSSDSDATAQDLRPVVVPAGGTKLVDFPNLSGDTELQNSFLVTSDAKPGSLLVRLASRNDSGRHDVEILAKDELDPTNAGNHPWSLEQGSDSTLLLFNHSTEAESFSVAISSDDMNWQKIYELMPMQTVAINLRKLAQDQTEDIQGHTFPKDVLSGQILWFARTSGIAKGRLLQSNREVGTARGFSCSGSTAICGIQFAPNTTTFSAGTTVTYGSIVPLSCDVTGEPPNACGSNGGTYPSCPTSKCGYSWVPPPSIVSVSGGSDVLRTLSLNGVSAGTGSVQTSVRDKFKPCGPYFVTPIPQVTVNPRISSVNPTTLNAGDTGKSVTISGAGFGASPVVSLPSGVSANNQQNSSDTSIVLPNVSVSATTAIGPNNITVTANGRPSNPSPFTIDGPDHMIVKADVLGHCSGCSTAVRRTVTLQVIKFGGSPVSVIPIGEVPSVSGWNCSQQFPGTISTPCAQGEDTDVNGIFLDSWSMASDVYSPVGCGYNITIHWQWCAAAKTFGTLSGYTHTNAINMNGVINPPNQFALNTPVYP